MPKIPDFTKASKEASKAGGVFTKSLDSMANGFRKLTGSADQAKNGLNQGRDAMGRFTAAGTGLKSLPPQVQAVATAMAATTIAILVTVGALGAMMVAAVEITQQRSALQATFSALGGGAAAGKATLAMVETLATKLPFASEQIAAWATSLSAAGFSGVALQHAIETVAAATAVMGESGGAAAKKLLETLAEGGKGATQMTKHLQEGSAKSNKMLKEMGISTEDVAKAMGMTVDQFKKAKISADDMGKAVEKAVQAKGADSLAGMMLTFPVILAKVKEGFASIFEKLGPSVKSFMAAVKGLFGQFGRGTPIISAIGKVATEAFGVLFKYATKAVTAISAWVKANVTAKSIGGVWASIKSAIGSVVSVAGKLWAAFGPIFKSPMFLKGLVAILKTIGVVMGVLAVVTGVTVTAIGVMAGIVMNVYGAIATAIGGIVEFVGSLLGLKGTATEIVAGLVGSVVGGIGDFVAAMANMASSGLAAFKSVLGIASPSKVMAQMGGHMGSGLEGGLDKSQGKVGGAAADLGAAAAGGVASGGGKGGGKSGKGGLTIGDVHLHVADSGHPAAWAEEAWAAFMERLAASQGL